MKKNISITLLLVLGLTLPLLAQTEECVLHTQDFNILSNSDLDPDTKEAISMGLLNFIKDYNKYVDVWDEDYDLNAEEDFFNLLDGRLSTTPYLNDIKEVPIEEPAIEYLDDIHQYFPKGYNYCLKGMTINGIEKLQDYLYVVKATINKTMEVHIKESDVVFTPRTLNMNMNLILQGDLVSGEYKAGISEVRLISIIDEAAGMIISYDSKGKKKVTPIGGGTVAVKEPKQKKKKEEPTYAVREESRSRSQFSNRSFMHIYGDYGYGLPRFENIEANNVDYTTKAYNLGLGIEYWRSIADKNKLYLSLGLLARRTSMTNNFTEQQTLTLKDVSLPNRAKRTDQLTFGASNSLEHKITTLYLPIGLVYNFGSHNDERVFTVQASVLPGFTIAGNREVTNNISYKSYYGDILSCDINNQSLNNLTVENKFTLSARLSPMYVHEVKAFGDGNAGWGFMLGLDLNVGLMPLFTTYAPQNGSQGLEIISDVDRANNTIKSKSNASILHNSATYHSIGGKIGVFYRMN